jgi:hypothetical protein
VFQVEPSESLKAIAGPKQWMLHASVIPLTLKRLTKSSARSLHEIPGIDTKSRGGIHGHYDIFRELRHGTSELRSSSKTVGTAWPLDREFRATKIVFERARAHEKIASMTPYVVEEVHNVANKSVEVFRVRNVDILYWHLPSSYFLGRRAPAGRGCARGFLHSCVPRYARGSDCGPSRRVESVRAISFHKGGQSGLLSFLI